MGKSKDLATGNSAAYVETAGDTMTGNLGIGAAPTSALSIEGSGFTDSTIRLKRTASGTNNDAGLQFTSAAGANSGYGMGGIWFKNSLDDNAYALIRARTDDSTGTSGRLDFITSDAAVGNATASRMTIDNAGRVTMPYQPAFHVGRNSNYTPGSGNAILFNDTGSSGHHFNRGSHYSTSTGRFTAPVAGVYHFSTCIIWGPSIGDGQNMADSFHIYKNNSLAVYSMRRAEYVNGSTGNDGYYTDFGNVTLDLAANDYVYVRTNSGIQVHGNDRYTWFNGFLIG